MVEQKDEQWAVSLVWKMVAYLVLKMVAMRVDHWVVNLVAIKAALWA